MVTINTAWVFYFWGLYDTSIVFSYNAKSSAGFGHCWSTKASTALGILDEIEWLPCCFAFFSSVQINVAIIVTFDILQNGDRNLSCTDGTSMVHFICTMKIPTTTMKIAFTGIWSLPFFETCTPKCTLFLPFSHNRVKVSVHSTDLCDLRANFQIFWWTCYPE